MISNIIQIFLGIFIVLILLLIAWLVYNYERIDMLKSRNNSKRKTRMFKGIYDYGVHEELIFNTYSKYQGKNYRDLIPSVNQKGGAEYSYNFWLKMDKEKLKNQTLCDDIILLMKGDKIQLNYLTDVDCKLINNNNKYIFIKNPLIRIDSKNLNSLVVEYNTITSPDSYRSNGNSLIKCNGGSYDDKNQGYLGIYDMKSGEFDKRWFMITLVLKEITPENDILNKFKTSCKIYLNGIKMLDREVESSYNGITNDSVGSAAMKHNRSPLFVNPTKQICNEETTKVTNKAEALMMADLDYYNYALEHEEVKKIFDKGFNKEKYDLLEDEEMTTNYEIAQLGGERKKAKGY
jgi:hypothetical protein